MKTKLTLVGISGSLRSGSYNTMLLNAVKEFLPQNVSLNIVPIADIPLYNADMDMPSVTVRPSAVVKLREELASADGIVIATPEYNYSIPGVLKNALDWVSRGADAPLLNKPISVMGATTGSWGTVRAQLAFHPIYQAMNMKPVYKPEVYVPNAPSKFDGNGRLTDELIIKNLEKNLLQLQEIILLNADR